MFHHNISCKREVTRKACYRYRCISEKESWWSRNTWLNGYRKNRTCSNPTHISTNIKVPFFLRSFSIHERLAAINYETWIIVGWGSQARKFQITSYSISGRNYTRNFALPQSYQTQMCNPFFWWSTCSAAIIREWDW